MQVFLETADIARELGLVPASVRVAVEAGHLKVAARTVRGTRLYRREDFEEYRRLRRARAKMRRSKPAA